MNGTERKALSHGLCEVAVDAARGKPSKKVLYAIGRLVRAVELIEDMAARIEDLERKQPQYRGTWKAGCMYSQGSFITHDGSVFCAMQDTDTKPGTDATWQLAVKRGRDGRVDHHFARTATRPNGGAA